MRLRLHLGAEGGGYGAVLADDERRAPKIPDHRPAHAVRGTDRPIGVSHERKRQVEALSEAILNVLRIGRDADDLGGALANTGVEPTKLAGLRRSPRRERLGEEEDDDRAARGQLNQRALADREVGCRILNVEHDATIGEGRFRGQTEPFGPGVLYNAAATKEPAE